VGAVALVLLIVMGVLVGTRDKREEPAIGGSGISEPVSADTSNPLPSSSPATKAPYTLTTQHSGLCLDVAGASQSAGVAVQQWNCTGGSNQGFNLEHVGNGFYRIKVKHSGQCLDVSGASQTSGVRVIQFPCKDGDNQLFSFISKGNGFYSITVKHSGKCLDIASGTAARGNPLIQHPCHGGPNQSFKLN
jgi:serine protease